MTFLRCYSARRTFLFLAVVLTAACNPVRGCIESKFALSPKSRLPHWLTLQGGLSRNDVDVELRYWGSPFDVDDAEFIMRDLKGNRINRVLGRSCWHPKTCWTPNGDGSFTPAPLPHYIIVTVDGVIEVISHPVLGPVFEVNDDPEVVRQARESLAKGECRKEPDNCAVR